MSAAFWLICNLPHNKIPNIKATIELLWKTFIKIFNWKKKSTPKIGFRRSTAYTFVRFHQFIFQWWNDAWRKCHSNGRHKANTGNDGKSKMYHFIEFDTHSTNCRWIRSNRSLSRKFVSIHACASLFQSTMEIGGLFRCDVRCWKPSFICVCVCVFCCHRTPIECSDSIALSTLHFNQHFIRLFHEFPVTIRENAHQSTSNIQCGSEFAYVRRKWNWADDWLGRSGRTQVLEKTKDECAIVGIAVATIDGTSKWTRVRCRLSWRL